MTETKMHLRRGIACILLVSHGVFWGSFGFFAHPCFYVMCVLAALVSVDTFLGGKYGGSSSSRSLMTACSATLLAVDVGISAVSFAYMFGTGYAAVPFIPIFFLSLPGLAAAVATVRMGGRTGATPVDATDERKVK